MVRLISSSTRADATDNHNENPTRKEIDAYIRVADTETLCDIVREIECKSGAGALLHPAEEYFVEAVAARTSASSLDL